MYHFIINPLARSGEGNKLWKQLSVILDEQQVNYQVHFTDQKNTTSEIARALSLKNESMTIVIVGGDGTVNEFMQGCIFSDHITLGYIPLGSGNDFARSLSIPSDPVKALLQILTPDKYTRLHIPSITCSDRSCRFSDSSGVGFDASICFFANTSYLKQILNKLHLGKFIYVLLAIKQILFFKPFSVRIKCDRSEPVFIKNCFFISGMNLPYEGGGLKMAPDTTPSQSSLDICIVHDLPKLLLLLLLPSAYIGKHILFKKYVTVFSCKKIKMQTCKPQYVHIDGESLDMHSKITISASSDYVRIITG